ncbi:MAG: rod shape-determining protein MreC [Croceitalea sp.]|nr:rod shape-determining protein MreC [Croceitalea sp.]NNM17094.1 rod shape-determining protein MreC [Croceitalea sp.]
MQRIINFILEYRNAFLYAFLALVSLIFTLRSHSYHQSKFFNSSKWISGSVYNASSNIKDYFKLREENERLATENQRLRYQLFNRLPMGGRTLDSSNIDYEVIFARVTKNSFASPRNYLTIDKGLKDSIKQDMGVITTKGILGIVENTSQNYATVQSILNTKSIINAKIKNTNYFGSLIWDAKKYDVVQLIDIPRLVPLTVGDTIVTGAMSSIFPENIPIGVIKKYDLNQAKSFYNIDIALFNDMANIKNVYIIKNRNKAEVLELEKSTNDVE